MTFKEEIIQRLKDGTAWINPYSFYIENIGEITIVHEDGTTETVKQKISLEKFYLLE
jgi:hypothetical protein